MNTTTMIVLVAPARRKRREEVRELESSLLLCSDGQGQRGLFKG